jgi:hypothetical protein
VVEIKRPPSLAACLEDLEDPAVEPDKADASGAERQPVQVDAGRIAT